MSNRVLGVGFCVVAVQCAWAATVLGQSAEIPAEVIQSQDKAIHYYLEQTREFEQQAREKERAQEVQLPRPTLSPGDPVADDGPFFNLNQIELRGSSRLSQRDRYWLVAPYLARPINTARLNELVRRVTNFYINNGYTTTRTYIAPGQNLTQGKLVLQVVEGKVSKVLVREGSGISQGELWTAFPNIEGKVLKIQDVEQGLNNLNRLKSMSATVKFLPDPNQFGDSLVVIENYPSSPYYGQFSYDNNSRYNVRAYPQSIGVGLENILNWADRWDLNFSQDNGAKGQNSNSQSLSLSIPFGYWMASFSHSRYEYYNAVETRFGTQRLRGESQSDRASLQYDLFHSRRYDAAISSGLTVGQFNHYNQDFLIEVQSGRTAVMDASLSQRISGWWGHVFTTASYYKGLDQYGATSDFEDIQSDEPRYQFEKTLINASWMRPLHVWKLPFTAQSSVTYQFANHALHSNQRMGIGSLYTVRGFREESVYGEVAFYNRNELIFPMDQIFTPVSGKPWLSGMQFYLGYDSGVARALGSRASNDGHWGGWLSGMAVGMKRPGKRVSYNMVVTRPLTHPSYMEVNPIESYFSVTMHIN